MKRVVSLYDYTGEACRPWAESGFDCYAFDVQHNPVLPRVEHVGGGSITYIFADLHDPEILSRIAVTFRGAAFGMAFPVCTDMAVSGSRHFESKRGADPMFQDMAATYARLAWLTLDKLGCPFFVENPVSALSSLWRKPDFTFDPFEYGGYIPQDRGEHPRWPEYIAPFDAYPKKTCLWTGGGYRLPEKRPVPVPEGYSRQFYKLGGKSEKTKNIRSATPRGFAIANFMEHQHGPAQEALAV